MGFPWYAALPICLIFGAAAGTVNAILTNVFRLQPFIATLAMASVCQGIGFLLCNGRNISLNDAALNTLGAGRIFSQIPIAIIFLIVFYAIFAFVLNRTTFGRSIYVIGGNPTASHLAGLDPKRISTILYIISGVLAALAGCLLAGRMRSGAPNAITGSEFDAIIAAVLGGVAFTGGRGTLGGCLLGLLIIQCFNNGLNFMGLSSFWQMVAKGLLLIGALLVDYVRSLRAD
jgi:ribose transport system permease protein